MLKRRLVTAGAALAISLSMFGGAMATPPGAQFGANDTQVERSNNCVAIASAPVRHNGQHITLGQGGDPSHGARGDEIKDIHAFCNAASE